MFWATAFEIDFTAPIGAVEVISLSVPPDSEPPEPTHSNTFAVGTAPPFVNSMSTRTSPSWWAESASVASGPLWKRPSGAANTVSLKNQNPMNAVPLLSKRSAPKVMIVSPEGLPRYLAAYALMISSLSGTEPFLCRHDPSSSGSFDPPPVKIVVPIPSCSTPVFTSALPPSQLSVFQSSGVGPGAASVMLPSSSKTPLMSSVPVGVGAAVAAPFRLSIVVQWSIFALVKRAEVVASMVRKSRLSTPTPMVHFQRFLFLLMGVPPCGSITQLLWSVGDTCRLEFHESVGLGKSGRIRAGRATDGLGRFKEARL